MEQIFLMKNAIKRIVRKIWALICVSILLLFIVKFNDHASQKEVKRNYFQENSSTKEWTVTNLSAIVRKSCRNNTSTLFAVMADPLDYLKRKNIRKLWGRRSDLSDVEADLIFFVGTFNSRKLQKKIEKEMKIHHDIVQFNFQDEYQHLSSKSIFMLQWFAKFCGGVKWFVKSDVDAFWNVGFLSLLLDDKYKVTFLNKYKKYIEERWQGSNQKKIIDSPKTENRKLSPSNTTEFDIICPVAKGLKVCRKPERERCEERYVVSKNEYEKEAYPPHCHGFGYILSKDIVGKILANDRRRLLEGLQRFKMEDIYVTGMLSEELQPKYLDIS